MKNKIILLSVAILSFLFQSGCSLSIESEPESNAEIIVDTVIDKPKMDYLSFGKELAMQIKANLGKNLGMALSEKGAAGAVEFCNTRAIPITDSMSIVLNAKIKRVSDKPRNENNQANADELAYIQEWKDAKLKGEVFAPKVTEQNGKMIGYYPIETNAMCMQCHGEPIKQVNKETLSKISKLYPADKALGYAEGEIRGIFVVEMDKK